MNLKKFFFKDSEKTTLKIYTHPNILTRDILKPDFSYKFAPSWFKNLSPTIMTEEPSGIKVYRSTVKTCPAIKNTFTSGIIIPLWTDIILLIDLQKNIFNYKCADNTTNISFHAPELRTGFYENHLNVKINSPHRIICNNETNFLFTSPLNREESNPEIKIVSGILNFYDQSATNINLFIPLKKQHQTYQYLLKAGTPIVQIFPLLSEQIYLEHIKLDVINFESKFKRNHPKFAGSYRFLKYLNYKNES